MGSSDQNLTEIRPSASINPLKPVTRLDGHSRSVITHRLCRCVQDHLPDLEDQVVLLYTLLLSSFCDSNSTFKIKQEPKFHSEILKEIESVIGSNQPLVTKSSVSAFFWDSSILRYPVKEALLLLWSDALPILRLRFPSLSRFIHESMLNRSTRQIMPAALLSLDAFNH